MLPFQSHLPSYSEMMVGGRPRERRLETNTHEYVNKSGCCVDDTVVMPGCRCAIPRERAGTQGSGGMHQESNAAFSAESSTPECGYFSSSIVCGRPWSPNWLLDVFCQSRRICRNSLPEAEECIIECDSA